MESLCPGLLRLFSPTPSLDQPSCRINDRLKACFGGMLFGMDSGIIGGVLTMDEFKRFVLDLFIDSCPCSRSTGKYTVLTMLQQVRIGESEQSRRSKSFRQHRVYFTGWMFRWSSCSIPSGRQMGSKASFDHCFCLRYHRSHYAIRSQWISGTYVYWQVSNTRDVNQPIKLMPPTIYYGY